MKTLNRRSFLKQNLALASCLASGFNVLNGTRAAHAANIDGYKALVCVYLAGGNDSFNMFAPASAAAHADYANARQFLAIPRAQLLPVSPAAYSDGADYGFHPSMTRSKNLFDQGSLAVIANVGTLTNPITKEQYESQSRSIPAQLFSHNDQTSLWMAGNANQGTGRGWAGKLMDLLYTNSASAPRPSPSISVAGNNLWQTGNVRSFEISAGGIDSPYLPYHEGAIKLDDAYAAEFQRSAASSHKLISEHAGIQSRAIEFGALVGSALSFAPTFSQAFGNGELQKQLEMVAKLIAVRDRLDTNIQRQVFFVQLGGWDTHGSQVEDNAGSHANLLARLDQSLGAFDAALVELGLQNQVTTFTATEFGRSLTPNGSGSDHGWGGHSLVMGGAVNGNDIYGTMPQLSFDSIDAIENNRIIPTSSVDQYGATMARWFGLNASELNSVFPNLQNFASSDLGFMG
jgi:uncharacterized protein (DUF1501 family)